MLSYELPKPYNMQYTKHLDLSMECGESKTTKLCFQPDNLSDLAFEIVFNFHV